MKVYKFTKIQNVAGKSDKVFEFFSRPENLTRITPSKMGFSIMTPSPLEMRVGLLIDYTVKVAGIPVRWRTYISDYDPPNYFIDQQLKGPYNFWHHRHQFVPIDGGTRIIDTVTYCLPFGIIGSFAGGWLVKRQLNKIFKYRSEAVIKMFGEVK